MKWINIEKEMPKENQDILIWSKDYDSGGNAYLSNGKFLENGRGQTKEFIYKRVTHWMPFPKAPKI